MLFKKRSLWIVLAENTPDSVIISTLSETIHKDRFYFLSLWIVFSIFMDRFFYLYGSFFFEFKDKNITRRFNYELIYLSIQFLISCIDFLFKFLKT